MRRKRRNRATWFPILGFANQGAGAQGLVTTDTRQLSVPSDGGTQVTVIPIIPDVTVPPEQLQAQIGTGIISTLRDFVEGQTCIIERIVGNIQIAGPTTGEVTDVAAYGVCAAVAVVPSADDGSGDPAISVAELDPWRADNSSQPWLWRRTWFLGGNNGSLQVGNNHGYPSNNLFGSLAEGSKIDTKGTKRAIRREERIFLIYSTIALFPDSEATDLLNSVHVHADLRVIGRLVKAHNRSNFK